MSIACRTMDNFYLYLESRLQSGVAASEEDAVLYLRNLTKGLLTIEAEILALMVGCCPAKAVADRYVDVLKRRAEFENDECEEMETYE